MLNWKLHRYNSIVPFIMLSHLYVVQFAIEEEERERWMMSGRNSNHDEVDDDHQEASVQQGT